MNLTQAFFSIETFLFCALLSLSGMKQSAFASDMAENYRWQQFAVPGDTPFDINRINALEIYNDTLWECTAGGVVGRPLDGRQAAIYSNADTAFRSHVVYDMAIDKNGCKWVATWECVYMFNGSDWIKHDSILSSRINADPKGNIWVAMDSTFRMFDGAAWKTIPTAYPIYDFAFDTDGTLWLSSHYTLEEYDGSTWISHPHPYGAPAASGLRIDNNNTKWLFGYGIISFKDDTWTFHPSTWDHRGASSSSAPPGVNDIAFDPYGNIWYAAGDGMGVFKGDAWASFASVSGYFTAAQYDPDDKMWFGDYYNGGVYAITPVACRQDTSVSWKKISEFSEGSYPVTLLNLNGTIIAIDMPDRKFRVSSNHGTDWDIPKCSDTLFDRCTNSTITILNTTLYINQNGRLFSSSDHGKTWIAENDTNPALKDAPWISMEDWVGTTPDDSLGIYGDRWYFINDAVNCNYTFAGQIGVYYSEKNTTTWTPINRGLPLHTRVNIVSSGSYIIAAAAEGIYRIRSDLKPDTSLITEVTRPQSRPTTNKTPAVNGHFVSVSVHQNTSGRLLVFSLDGRCVYRENVKLAAGMNHIRIADVVRNPGTYFISVRSDDGFVNSSTRYLATR